MKEAIAQYLETIFILSASIEQQCRQIQQTRLKVCLTRRIRSKTRITTMPLETIAFNAPIEFQDVATNTSPILKFYTKYALSWQDEEKLYKISPNSFYSDSCTFVMPDNSTVSGLEKIWPLLVNQYGQFAKTEREPLSLILVSDPEKDKHELHLKLVLSLYRSLDAEPVKLTQSFTYEIGKADEGAGTDGCQIRKIWNAYDRSVIAKAADGLSK